MWKLRIHWINWEKICSSRENGGFGLGGLESLIWFCLGGGVGDCILIRMDYGIKGWLS